MKVIVKEYLKDYIDRKEVNWEKLQAKIDAIVKSKLNNRRLIDPNTQKELVVDDKIQFRYLDKLRNRRRPFFIKNPSWDKVLNTWVADEILIGEFDLRGEAYYDGK